MITYIETNFLLELGYRQEHVSSCEKILSLGKTLDLRISAASLCEPYFHYIRRVQQSETVLAPVEQILKQLERSTRFRQRAIESAAALSQLLITTNELDKLHLDLALDTIAQAAHVIPLTAEVTRSSLDLQKRFGLKPLDSIIVASLLLDFPLHQQQRPKVFLTRDKKMFFDADLRKLFDDQTCRIVSSFPDAVSFIEAQL